MKVLSLNGGGTKGYMSLCILTKLEEAFGNKYKTHEIFDMIGGVSTGSIIGAFLCKGYSAKETLDRYHDFIPRVFSNPRWFLPALFYPKYDRGELERVCRKYLGYDINKSKTKFMTYAVRINGDEIVPKFWKSWRDSINVADVVLASTAAPTYFAPYAINDTYYIDGGMACNNPSMCVISEALRCGATLENLYNVNITCDFIKGYKNPQSLEGMYDWATKAIDVSLYASSGIDEYQAHTLLGFRNHYIQPSADFALDCMDFDLMQKAADAAWGQHKDALIENLAPDK